ncbi:hypothetical protein [Pseudanabaena yagii]|uniref:Rubredoxin n=1 Tax=Pseudanabaena yagii GIHE-NHR1 TaxID=2722753 RepID=A0ABX1LYB1_9CYAN|nr:hypothetical protein [Pseudanabaena yagii]NMF59080.1 hypothetical protein [Pseudanabaena yagii GIHE-NHR1]NMF59744.1 hypothetical protein [Pseudanabaena yagii GIHE-NHR1]
MQPFFRLVQDLSFPTLPWTCPECRETIEDYDEMSFDVIAIAKEPIEFI